jgi:chemotaxis protein methyltransferase CheR
MVSLENSNKPLYEQIRDEIKFLNVAISDTEMRGICILIKKYSGITLKFNDKQLVLSRLTRRLKVNQIGSFHEYISLLETSANLTERTAFIDALTTNETYFFREPNHFDFLTKQLVPEVAKLSGKVRIWSAAASQGQEAYSIAMTLASCLTYKPWEVFGSDINQQVLSVASKGIYPLERLSLIPDEFLKKYCLQGSGPMAGLMAISSELKQRVSFDSVNLNDPLPVALGKFDAIFLRNVLIYFDKNTQHNIVRNVLSFLKPGGYFFIGTSEYLDTDALNLIQVKKSVYQFDNKTKLRERHD